MINTYQTSLAPPPVPPRHSRPHSVLIPAPHLSQGRSKPLISLLVTLVLLELLLSVGGFVYLYHNCNTVNKFKDDNLKQFRCVSMHCLEEAKFHNSMLIIYLIFFKMSPLCKL